MKGRAYPLNIYVCVRPFIRRPILLTHVNPVAVSRTYARKNYATVEFHLKAGLKQVSWIFISIIKRS